MTGVMKNAAGSGLWRRSGSCCRYKEYSFSIGVGGIRLPVQKLPAFQQIFYYIEKKNSFTLMKIFGMNI
jgi:hypothetical protein